MRYYITVTNNNRVVERIVFEHYDVALYFADRRRKQGYEVTVITIK